MDSEKKDVEQHDEYTLEEITARLAELRDGFHNARLGAGLPPTLTLSEKIFFAHFISMLSFLDGEPTKEELVEIAKVCSPILRKRS